MSPTFDAFLCSWPFDPGLLAALGLFCGIYWRGWLWLQNRDPVRWRSSQRWAFLSGLAAIFLALASPIEPFAALFLQVHMLQHLLLMMVAPPLLWLGEPFFPLLRGLPEPIRTVWAAPLLRSKILQNLFVSLTNPWTALPLFVATTWLWHLPAVYDRTLTSSGLHYLQHTCFLSTALLFWYPVVRPYPAQPRWSLWLLLPYLLLADVQNTILSALLTFSGQVLYPYYAQMPRLDGVSALDDQAAAGVLMWVPGSVAFLLPLFWIGTGLFGGQYTLPARRQEVPIKNPVLFGRRISLPLITQCAPIPRQTKSSFDLLKVPYLGSFLKWRHARLLLQLPMLVLAGVLIGDGLWGPQIGPMNLAGVLPWIHWRGLLILALLTAGNVFCLACPFMVPRNLARRWLPGHWNWPRQLRNKWLAVLLLVLFLWAYEVFTLWDSPWWTAWIAVGYFAAAFLIDSFFRGAAFCKYLCPIGQFNFVQSLVSPLEVRVRDPERCGNCRTHDCIQGRDDLPGCELHLFQSRKVGNMDCTFCLDCIHACPHDNVGVITGTPGRDLWYDPVRSGVGRFSKRHDVAALLVVLVFGAFANAAGMVGPVLDWQNQLANYLGNSLFWVSGLFYLLTLVVLPLLLVSGATTMSRWWGPLTWNWLEIGSRFVFALVPLGFAMWFAHYSFHFLTSYDTLIPTAQRLAYDLGWTALGEPTWVASCCRPVVEWLPRLEILCLDLGLLLSLYTGYRITGEQSTLLSIRLRTLTPWVILIVLLYAVGVWIVLQPMQMRGTLGMG